MLRNCACLVIAHMVDATQLCLSCICTHGGCYATVLVLSLHTWWMLRNCACLVIAHMVDATQLCLSCNCTHGGCYATVLVLSLHTWWMLRNCACLVIAHMMDATQLCLSCHCTHGGCYATVLVLSLHTWWMLRNCACLVIAHMETIEKIHTERASQPRPNHQTCQPSFGGICLVVFVQNERAAEVAWSTGQIGPKSKQCYKIEKKTSFFRRRLLIRTNSIVYSFLKTRTHGKNGTKSTYEPTNHTWNSTPSQHFVHLQQNAMLISLRVAITAVTLFLEVDDLSIKSQGSCPVTDPWDEDVYLPIHGWLMLRLNY